MSKPPTQSLAEKEFEEKLELQKKELTKIANLISSKGIKLKQASLNEKSFDYFRGDNFHQVVLENKEEIMSNFKDVKAISQLEKLEDSIKLGQLFMDYKLLLALDRHPRIESELKKKYPKHLVPTNAKFSDKGFYSWNIPKPKGKLALLLFLGIMIVIAFMLFSIWPLWVKIGLWYFSFYTLIVLVGFIMLRLSVWLFLFHFGIDFWIFPNFFIDSSDLLDSFRPLLSFERRDDDVKMFIIRLVSAISLIFFVFQLAKEPDNLDNIASFTNENLNDLFNWGNDKFVLGQLPGGGGNSTVRRKSAQEVFMEAILEPEYDDEETDVKKEEVSDELHEDHINEVHTEEEEIHEHKKIDLDTLGLVDDEEHEEQTDQGQSSEIKSEQALGEKTDKQEEKVEEPKVDM